MKETTKNNIKFGIIIILLILIIGLIVFGINYAIKNRNSDDVTTLKDFDYKITIGKDQLDTVKLPTPNVKLIYNEFPKSENTIQEVDFKTMEKIFKTNGKSLLILVKDDCKYCDQYLPTAEKALNDLNLNAYKINVSKLSNKEKENIYKYIDYDGTPTTYNILDGKAKHSLSGMVDEKTLKAFIDYFYIRNY